MTTLAADCRAPFLRCALAKEPMALGLPPHFYDMSYAHTKRRKLITTLKRKHPRNWHEKFSAAVIEVQKKRDGELLTQTDAWIP